MEKSGGTMGDGPVLSVLLRLGAPAMISMFFQNLYSLVDTVFVSWLGTHELAAMSLCVPVFFLAMALVKGVAVGGTALMSHARGARNSNGATDTAACAMPLALLILSPFFLLVIPSVNAWFFGFFDVEAPVLIQVDRYMFWLVWSFPVMGFAMICEGIHMSYGNSRTPMTAYIIGNLANIALDPLLMFTWGMGIAGASLASLAGWGISGAIMWASLRQNNLDRPAGRCTMAQWKYTGKITAAGGPVAAGMLIIPFSIMGLNYVLASFGPEYVGAWNLSSRLEQMIILPLYGLSCALIPFVGFNQGSGNAARIREGVRTALAGSYAVLIPAAVLLWVFAPEAIALFRPAPEVRELCTHAFRLALLGYWLAPFELVMNGTAQGLRQSHYTLIINLLRLLALRLPLAFLFGRMWGGESVYASHMVSIIITGTACVFVLRHLMRRMSRGPVKT
jgi:putative MATE family efflux protein